MREVPYLGKKELIALIRELAKVAVVKGERRKHLKAVLREADRQEKKRKGQALKCKLRREKRAKEQLKVWKREELARKKEKAKWARQQEEKHAAWIKRHGDHDIETIFGIPVRLESFEEAALSLPPKT